MSEHDNQPLPGAEMAPIKPDEADEAPDTMLPRRRTRLIEVCFLAVALVVVALLAGLFAGVIALAGGVGSLFSTSGTRANPPEGTYSILSFEGTLQTSSAGSYRHTATVDYIKKMAEDEGNLGLLLYFNTGGGGVYESDEVYRALMAYKEATGRPVWAYMARTCASGGYWICAAADTIISGHNVTTGSIGVYYQLTDSSGLYEKLGIETVLVRTGDNKGIGVDGVKITEENRAVYQSMVDESYARFVDIIAAGRGMSLASVKALADGRPYTENQALANGLVDEIAEWEDVKTRFEALCGGSGYSTSFATTSGIQQIINTIFGALPKSDTQALLELAEGQTTGLMAYAGELV